MHQVVVDCIQCVYTMFSVELHNLIVYHIMHGDIILSCSALKCPEDD